jgi:hypothetical protein
VFQPGAEGGVMAQNTSSAVMQQRAEPHDSLDDFPTPSWATRALMEHIIIPSLDVFSPRNFLSQCRAWEPACNRGFMARPLKEYFGQVHCSDIFDYDWEGQDRICDFLFPESESPRVKSLGVEWTITNPPFRLAEQFIQRSFELKGWQGTAVIVRTSFLEGVGRYNDLFSKNPPSIVL